MFDVSDTESPKSQRSDKFHTQSHQTMTSTQNLKTITLSTTKQHITTLTLNTKLNLFSPQLFKDLSTALQIVKRQNLGARCLGDTQTRVLILQNRPDSDFFSAGLDLKAYGGLFMNRGGSSSDNDSSTSSSDTLPPPKGHLLTQIQQMQHSLRQFRDDFDVPVIAAIDGTVIGAALDLISFADMRFATKRSQVSLRETKVGIVADLGSLQRLARIVSNGKLRWMAFSGEDFDAKWCLEAQLFDHVAENRESLDAHVQSVAKSIASNSPLVVQGAKRMINYSEEHSLDESLEMVRLWNGAFLKSEDLTEAMMAFMQKRRPKFRNRL